jgi:hypothetical protein
VKEIVLSDGSTVMVDDDDYEFLAQWKWSANGNGYAVRNERYAPKKYRKTYLHRQIMKARKGEYVDHINGDIRDNRKANLRICSNSQNSRNSRKKQLGYSRYKGVTIDKRTGKWVAQIMVDRKNIHLGSFSFEREAAQAYNDAAVKFHGEYAKLNEINEEEST